MSQAPDEHKEKQDEEELSGQEDAEEVEQKGRGVSGRGFSGEPCGAPQQSSIWDEFMKRIKKKTDQMC